MSSVSDTPDHPDEETTEETDDPTDRQRVIEELREVRDYAKYKSIGDGRIRDPDLAKERIKYLRLFVYTAKAEREYLRDRDLEEMDERLSELEAVREESDLFL